MTCPPCSAPFPTHSALTAHASEHTGAEWLDYMESLAQSMLAAAQSMSLFPNDAYARGSADGWRLAAESLGVGKVGV